MARQQRDFNADMGNYLDQRRGTSSAGFSFFRVDSFISKRSPSNNVPVHDDVGTTIVEPSEKKRGWLSFLFSSRSSTDVEDIDMDDLPADVRNEVEELEEDIDYIDHEVDELEEKRSSLFARFFTLLRMRRPKEPEGDVDPGLVAHAIGDHARNEALVADTRAVLKDMHKWLGKLPPEQIESFKRSPDFNRYKDLLEQYGLIR